MTSRDDGHDQFRMMFDRNYGRVLRFFRTYNVRHEDAEELAQEVFTRLFKNFAHYRGEAEWGFLEKVARNLLINWWRDRSAAKRHALMVDIDDPESNPALPAVRDADYGEREATELRQKRLYDAIADLPEGQRQCLHPWLDDKKYEEIAATLRISVDAVKSRLRDARKTLRARLGDDGNLPGDEE
jgi:RNA polymerase sigma-70 factor (ECF subfamily)